MSAGCTCTFQDFYVFIVSRVVFTNVKLDSLFYYILWILRSFNVFVLYIEGVYLQVWIHN